MPNQGSSGKSGVKCKIWWDSGAQCYRMTLAWSPAAQNFIETLKQLIPGSDRDYQPDTKIWSMPEKYLGPIEKMAKGIWFNPGDVVVIKRADAEKASSNAITTTSKLDVVLAEFVKLLPFDAAQAAYRKAAMTLHPDRGGDMTRMSNLNALWDRISKEYYKQ